MMASDALSTLLSSLELPPVCVLNERIAKKLLVENGAATPADKRAINEGIDELIWVAALKPNKIGVPAYRDDFREYLEIAILSMRCRAEARSNRITEIIHRSIPYPVLLVSIVEIGQEENEISRKTSKPNHTWFTLALRRRNTQQTDSLRYHVVIKALKQQQSQDANS